MIISIIIFSIPYGAHAGFFSFVSDVLGLSTTNATVETSQNSQTMPVLRAPLNTNPNGSTGGGDVLIVDNAVLTSDSGFIEGNGTEGPTNSGISLYVVRDGDSLSGIAKMFGVSINTIIWANDLSSPTIKPGQQLVILPISGVKHTVKSGETLQGIVAKYKADLEETLKYNDIAINSVLSVGDELVIPDAELATSGTSSGSTYTAKFSGYPAYSGYYIRPINGGRKTQGIHGYNAIDLGAPIGTPVMAAASGQIVIARGSGWNGGYGKYIVISHDNGTQTLYSHLNDLLVYSGRVIQGQVIGTVGTTGKVTGPHLHFEIRGAKNPF